MAKPPFILLLVIGALFVATRSPAQTTNLPPATTLEAVETSPNQLVLKGSFLMGSVAVQQATITLVCKEDAIINPSDNTRVKWYGCSFGIKVNNQTLGRTLIDYDEMDSLLKAVEYMKNVTWSVTPLPSFDLVYTTKAGLRFSVFSDNRESRIQFLMRNNYMDKRIFLTSDQIAQLYSLLQQTKAKLDDLRKS
ncbi:MAG TPA: hypothetical protein VH597_12770 [Verrucomicrobiae bacterium]|jgi:hypothetical protein|nr:hypothetical protein [Verrucomicrobiae bacterium]